MNRGLLRLPARSKHSADWPTVVGLAQALGLRGLVREPRPHEEPSGVSFRPDRSRGREPADSAAWAGTKAERRICVAGSDSERHPSPKGPRPDRKAGRTLAP